MPTEALFVVSAAIANATSAALSGAATALSGAAAATAPAAALHPAAAAALVPGGLGVGLSTSGFLGLFFLGALASLERLGIFSPALTPLAGASGGALVGLSACLGVPTDTALAIARDMTRLCLPRGSCAGFLDAPVRRMVNATLSAAVAGTGRLPLSVLTSPDGFGGWGSGGNFSSRGEGVAAAATSAAALRASGSPEYWRVADELVRGRCAGRFHVMVSELVRGQRAVGSFGGAARPAEAGGGGGGAGSPLLALGPAAATPLNLTWSVVGNGTQAALATSALSLVSDPLSGRQAAAAAASAADAALAGGGSGALAGAGNGSAADAAVAALAAAAASQVRGRASAETGLVPLPPSSSGGGHSPSSSSTNPQQHHQDNNHHARWAAWPVTDFLSAPDAADAVAGSAFIPIFSGPSITTAVRGRPAADGMLVQPLPCPPGVRYCVRISAALPGEALVQGTRVVTNPDIAPGLRVPFRQTLRQWQARALTSPTFAVTEALVWLGEREAEAWAVEVGLATEERVALARARGVAGAAARAAADEAGAAASAAGPAAAAAAASATSALTVAPAGDADVATIVTAVEAPLAPLSAAAAAAPAGAGGAGAWAVVPARAAASAAAAVADAAAVAAAKTGGGGGGSEHPPSQQQQQQQRPPLLLRKMLRMRAK